MGYFKFNARHQQYSCEYTGNELNKYKENERKRGLSLQSITTTHY